MNSWHRSLSFALLLSASLLGCDDLPKKKGKGSRSADPQTEIAKDVPPSKVSNAVPALLPGGAVPGQLGGQGPAPAPANDYFKDPSSLPGLVKTARACTECRAISVVIFPDFANVQLQDPKVPLNVDDYTVRGGRVENVRPVEFHGAKPTVENIRAQSFDLDKELPWAMLPKMIEETGGLLKIEGAKVSHLSVRRGLTTGRRVDFDAPFSGDVKISVHARGPRRSGRVEFDTTGKVIKVHD